MTARAVVSERAAVCIRVAACAFARHADIAGRPTAVGMAARARGAAMLAIKLEARRCVVERGCDGGCQHVGAAPVIGVARSARPGLGAVEAATGADRVADLGVTAKAFIVGDSAKRDVARIAARFERRVSAGERARRHERAVGRCALCEDDEHEDRRYHQARDHRL